MRGALRVANGPVVRRNRWGPNSTTDDTDALSLRKTSASAIVTLMATPIMATSGEDSATSDSTRPGKRGGTPFPGKGCHGRLSLQTPFSAGSTTDCAVAAGRLTVGVHFAAKTINTQRLRCVITPATVLSKRRKPLHS